jgi:hypothetical protein
MIIHSGRLRDSGDVPLLRIASMTLSRFSFIFLRCWLVSVATSLTQLIGQAVQASTVTVALLERPVRRVQLLQQRTHGLGADLGLERPVALFAGLDAQLVVLVLVQQLLVLQVLLPGVVTTYAA